MALDVYFRSDVRGAVLAGLVLCVQTARATGDNVEFLRGALAAYQHQAIMFQMQWTGSVIDNCKRVVGIGLLDEARNILGADLGTLIDAALPRIQESV